MDNCDQKVVKSGNKLGKVEKVEESGEKLRKMGKSGKMFRKVVKSDEKWLTVGTIKWPNVGKSWERWEKVQFLLFLISKWPPAAILEVRFAAKTIGVFHYMLSMAMSNMKLIGEFMTQLEMPQTF